MVEKMTAVWLIILTIIVCASVPAILIYLTTEPHPTTQEAAKMLFYDLFDPNEVGLSKGNVNFAEQYH